MDLKGACGVVIVWMIEKGNRLPPQNRNTEDDNLTVRSAQRQICFYSLFHAWFHTSYEKDKKKKKKEKTHTMLMKKKKNNEGKLEVEINLTFSQV